MAIQIVNPEGETPTCSFSVEGRCPLLDPSNDSLKAPAGIVASRQSGPKQDANKISAGSLRPQEIYLGDADMRHMGP